jgi:two-component system cell cycle sensor histidine kinase/response regulator CckA
MARVTAGRPIRYRPRCTRIRGDTCIDRERLRRTRGARGVVEDDDSVRSVIQRLLERAGYRVTTAEHGEAALQWLTASPRAPDLILTDLNMPVMGGLELRARVHARAPEQVVLFMSGYNAEAAGLHGEFDASSLIQKPPVPAQLLGQVRRALDDRRREQRSVS